MNKIQLLRDGIIFSQNQSDYKRFAIHSEDEQYIKTGVMNTGDYILEGRFRINYIDPPTANGDGNWIVGGRKMGSYTLGLFIGSAGVFNAYGYGTASNRNQILVDEWYTYRLSMANLVLTDDYGNVKTYSHSGGSRLIPESQSTEIRICSITGNYTGSGEDMRRMWGDHDYHKCTDRTTGEVLYHFEAVADKNNIGCFLNKLTNELKYSDSDKDFTVLDIPLS